MTRRVGALVMAALLALYLVFAGYYASVLFSTGQPVGIAIGVGLLVLALLGAGFIAAEIVFGVRAERIARRLEQEGGLPEEQLPLAAQRVVLEARHAVGDLVELGVL